MREEIAFKIDFLRAMTQIMTPTDLAIFERIATRLVNGETNVNDLYNLDQLFKKFDRPAGNEKI